MSVAILGIGTAKPVHSITQADAAESAKRWCCHTDQHERVLPTLYRRTHVDRRNSVLLDSSNGKRLRQSFYPPASDRTDRGPTTAQRMQRYTQDAAPLAVAAIREALECSGTAPSQISQLVTVSCTGFFAPGVDIGLIKQLGLPPTVGRTHIGFMGCHGALNGLRVVSALTEADAKARVLMCAVELCSLHFHYGWDPDKIVANALFADGAAALVATRTVEAASENWRLVGNGSYVVPDSEGAMTWRIGDHGFVMTLSARVPALIEAHLWPWLEQWLAGYGLTVDQVRAWAVHPGGPRIIGAVESSLGLAAEATAASRQVLADCGNMSSPTILFILDKLWREGALRPCVAMGFGPGLTVEAALLT